MIPLPTAADNPCGDCVACCVTPGIPWLDKPAKVPCKHLDDHGCGIHATKPAKCRDYSCGWLMAMDQGKVRGSGVTRDDLDTLEGFRPDRCGVIFQFIDDFLGNLNAVVAMETRTGAAIDPNVQRITAIFAHSHAAVLIVNYADGSKQVGVPIYPGHEAVARKLEDRLREKGYEATITEEDSLRPRGYN